MKQEIKQFDLERLRGNKVAVNCKTEEQAQDFINWVYSLGVDKSTITYWSDYEAKSCYSLSSDLCRFRSDIDFYLSEGYKVISYEEALLEEATKEQHKHNIDKMFQKGYISYNKYLELRQGLDLQEESEKYMVYVKGKGQPKVRHTYENAIKEAKRLSSKEIGKEVNVVKVLKTFKSEVIVNEVIGNEINQGESNDD